MSSLVHGRVVSRLALLLCSFALAACPSKSTKTKHPEEHVDKGPSADQLLADARAAAQAGDANGALAKYQAAFKAKADLTILGEEVDVMLALGRPDVALSESKAYYDAHPTDTAGIRVYSHVLIAVGDAATALQVADELLAMDDEDADAHYKKGEALVLSKQAEAGVEELRRAVQLDPKNPAYLVELGGALQQAGKVDEAALQLRAAIQLDPENGRALMLLGVALRDQSELEEAEVFLVKATKASKDARPWFELGVTQNKRGDDMGAEESLAQAVQIEPGNSLYQYAYGEMLRINKKIDDAVAAYRQAASATPPHPKAAAKLGTVLADAKRFDEAESALTEAIRNDPDNAINYVTLGNIYRDQKKTKQAIETYTQYLAKADKSDPDRAKADACLKALKKGKKCS